MPTYTLTLKDAPAGVAKREVRVSIDGGPPAVIQVVPGQKSAGTIDAKPGQTVVAATANLSEDGRYSSPAASVLVVPMDEVPAAEPVGFELVTPAPATQPPAEVQPQPDAASPLPPKRVM